MAPKKLIQEDDIDTKAGQTLHPHSDNASHAGDPKSKFEHMATMIGAAHTMRDTHLTKWWKDAVALVGNEARNIPGGTSDKNSSSIDAKGSDATTSKVSKQSYSSAMPSLKEAMLVDLNKIFGEDDSLSDASKKKMAALFETAVVAMVQLKEEEMKDGMWNQLSEESQEEFNEVVEGLVKSVDEFIEEVANKWLEDNEVAIETSIRSELAEDFIQGLKSLFMEHYVDIPEDRVDVVNSLAEKIEAMEAQLADVMEENIELRKKVEEVTKEEIVEKACEGLTLVDAEKLVELAEAVADDDIEEFAEKVKHLRESNFVKDNKAKAKPKATSLNESEMEHVDEEKQGEGEKTYATPEMASYVRALSRTARR